MMGYLNYCSVIWGLYTCKGHGDRAMNGEGGRGYRCLRRQLRLEFGEPHVPD